MLLRKPFRITLVTIAIFLMCQPLVFSDDSEAASGSLVFTEVHPREEAFTIANASRSAIDLKGCEVTDGEGSLVFNCGTVLDPGCTITLSAEGFGHEGINILFSDPSLEKRKSLILADSGDELLLFRGGKLADSVCWGKSKGADGWFGEPAGCSSGNYLLRTGDRDTDRPSDWIETKRGWSNLSVPSEGFEALVTPFSFPESRGIPLLTEIMSAEHSIDASIYLLTSPTLVSAMCQTAKNGVKVRILAEGTPLGVDISTEIGLLKALSDAGAEVRVINPEGCDSYRYLYVHSKYVVVDEKTTVVTSENWTKSNFGEGGNRGWGMVASSPELAGYFEQVFENDFSLEYGDVVPFRQAYPNAKTVTNFPVEDVPEYIKKEVSAKVFPVFSPDNSFPSMRSFIRSAEVRVYAEQMDLGSTMAERGGDTPIGWLADAAEYGVDTRFILDTSQSNGSTHQAYVNQISNATFVKAIGVCGTEGFDLIHNKGVIADDAVWVGSVNWTANSFLRNREAALIVESPYVAEYFASLFREDFGNNMYTAEEEGLEITAVRVSTSAGPMMMLSVNGPKDCEYEWDAGDGEVRRTSDNHLLLKLPAPGAYTASVRISGTDISCTFDYSVKGTENEMLALLSEEYLICAVAVLIIGTAATFLLRRRSGPAGCFQTTRYR